MKIQFMFEFVTPVAGVPDGMHWVTAEVDVFGSEEPPTLLDDGDEPEVEVGEVYCLGLPLDVDEVPGLLLRIEVEAHDQAADFDPEPWELYDYDHALDLDA